jgi:hypothetical protein
MLSFLIAFAACLVIAIAVTFPLITQVSTHLIGHPFGDTKEYVRHIWAMHEALRSGSNPFFQPLLLYPTGLDGTYLWSVPLQSFPQWLLMAVMPLPAAHNLTAIVTLALNGLSAFALTRFLLLHEPAERRPDAAGVFCASLISGIVFTTAPALIGQLGIGHTGLLVLYPAVLFALVLIALGDTARARRRQTMLLLIAGVLFAASLWGSPLNLFFITLPAAALILAGRALRREWRPLAWMGAAVALGGLLSLPFVLPALGEARSTANLLEDASVTFSADLLAFASPSFYNALYSGLSFNRSVLGIDPFEGAGYLGLVTAGLALIGVWRFRRARGWLLLAIACWVLSLGPLLKILGQPVTLTVDGYPTFISLPYALIQQLPVVSLGRTPARFSFSVALAMAMMAGYGAAALWMLAHRAPLAARAIPVAVIGALLVADTWWFAPFPTVDATIPEPVRALADDAPSGAVFNVPWDHLLTDKDGMYLQTGHGLPMIAGHITRRTPLDPARGWLLEETLDPALLNASGIGIIILHKDWADPASDLDIRLRAAFSQPIYEDATIAVFRVSPTDAAPSSFLFVDHVPAALETRGELYFHATEAGGRLVRAELESAQPRTVVFALDGLEIGRFVIDGAAAPEIWMPYPAGFHTLRVTLDPSCPLPTVEGVACSSVTVLSIALETP